jgi:hypothetical protein
MKILFLVYHGLSDISGISKKIRYQINGLRSLDNDVHVCTYDILQDGAKARMIDRNILQYYGKGIFAGLRKRVSYRSIVKYIIDNNIEFVYSRSFHNANPFTINMFQQLKKHGVKSVIEIPTYPYDLEYVGFPFKERLELEIDKLFRHKLAKSTDAIITYTDDCDIFGQKTIQISNGIELESIPLKMKNNDTSKEINFIGVAEVLYWHGYDRFIHGMGEYYKNGGTKELYFHIVGGVGPSEMNNSKHSPGFQELISKYDIKNRIIFHGQMFGEKLDSLFDNCDFAIGSLARHRSGITNIKTLKNREYAARGIPFVYSETDSDFDNKKYVIKAQADESAIDIQCIIDFINNVTIFPSEIRDTIVNLTWKEQMRKVLLSLYHEQI